MGNRKQKILVRNITKDDLVEMITGISLHHIVCDHIIEETGHIRKQELMICSNTEYESIQKYGYYEIDEDKET